MKDLQIASEKFLKILQETIKKRRNKRKIRKRKEIR